MCARARVCVCVCDCVTVCVCVNLWVGGCANVCEWLCVHVHTSVCVGVCQCAPVGCDATYPLVLLLDAVRCMVFALNEELAMLTQPVTFVRMQVCVLDGSTYDRLVTATDEGLTSCRVLLNKKVTRGVQGD